jgi:hypothetical protein
MPKQHCILDADGGRNEAADARLQHVAKALRISGSVEVERIAAIAGDSFLERFME